MIKARLFAILGLALGGATTAQADGTFLQFDLAPETQDAVFAGTRGKVSFGANYSGYDGGWSSGAFVARDVAFEGIGTLKLGPSLGTTDEADDWSLGAKVVAERYQPTSFGFMFLAAQFNTIDNDWFALVQVGDGKGLSVDFSAGGSDTYDERTIAVNSRIGDGPVSLRAGYRFLAETGFIGVSVNTY
ncbi:hypothetical protein [Salipiger mucosus]|uniref:Outer membrane protein beta-barrel domain-containing protein n=1 Tax=Salipiger mucosus DSM 16094 TaxID=1123237 RepID=S9RRL0_9RHOB|nr:hypothetical protein [Salipiger mucosus]EPX76584.1 hypothetical protein Salmuc_00416 [Salipiger mucosus DSM 16094]